jgi:hypothetical protein
MTTTAGPKARKRKNIEKDSRAYFLSHEAHRLFQRMAKKRHLPIGAFMELQAQELAQQILTPEERDEVRREAAAITARRRAEAEEQDADE